MTRMAEAEAQQDVSFTEMADQRDRLCDEVDRLSSDRGVLSVKRKVPLRRLSLVGTDGRFTEQKRLKDEAGEKTTDVQYKPDGAKAKIAQFEGLGGRVQEGVYRISGGQDG